MLFSRKTLRMMKPSLRGALRIGSGRRSNLLLIIMMVFSICLGFSNEACAVLYEDISALELSERILDDKDDGYIILDIRLPEEYAEGHIPGAINIPLRELGYSLYLLDKVKDIIVYCNIGLQSKVAAQVLANAGFKDVYNLTDGLKVWSYAFESSDGRVNI